MAASAFSTSFNCSSLPCYTTKTTSFRRRTSIVSVSTNPYNDSSSAGLSSKINGFLPKLDQSILLNSGLSNGPIEARNATPTMMPDVMTPGGPLDLSSVLFRNRIIFIGQWINSLVAQRVISQLVTLATIDENSDIVVYVNCPGGSIYSVLAIYDCMTWIKPKVGTVGFGIAGGEGAFLLAAGQKGMRYAMPNSRIMLHHLQSSTEGHIHHVSTQVKEALQNRDKLNKMYAAFTGQTLEMIQRYTERNRFLSAPEAMDFGLIDGILETGY